MHQIGFTVTRLLFIASDTFHGNVTGYGVGAVGWFARKTRSALSNPLQGALYGWDADLAELIKDLWSDRDFAMIIQKLRDQGQAGSEPFGADVVEALPDDSEGFVVRSAERRRLLRARMCGPVVWSVACASDRCA